MSKSRVSRDVIFEFFSWNFSNWNVTKHRVRYVDIVVLHLALTYLFLLAAQKHLRSLEGLQCTMYRVREIMFRNSSHNYK